MKYIHCKVRGQGGEWEHITLDEQEWAGMVEVMRAGDMVEIVEVENVGGDNE